jgi:hypothetical protein
MFLKLKLQNKSTVNYMVHYPLILEGKYRLSIGRLSSWEYQNDWIANSQSSELFYRQQRQEPKRSNKMMKLLHISSFFFFFNKLEFLTKNLFADEI